MTGGSGGVDGFHSSTHVEKRRFWKSGWYQPINKYLEDATLTPPDFDWNDILPGAKLAVQQPDKSISGIPTFVDPFVLFYRKDLYDQKGWKAPKTVAEMESQAKALHGPPGMYGIVYRGLKNANATPWAYLLYAMGGDYLTKDGKSAINTPEWAKTMDLYAGMLRQYGPPGVVNFNWYECSAAFMQGQVGIYFDGVNFANQFEDPAKSKIAGKVAYSVLPAGPGGHYTCTFTNAMAVSAQSKNKEAAYLFCCWSTNKQNAVRELLAGVGVGRASSLERTPRSRRSRRCRRAGTTRTWSRSRSASPASPRSTASPSTGTSSASPSRRRSRARRRRRCWPKRTRTSRTS